MPGVPNGYTVQLLAKVKEANLNYVETTFSSQATNLLVLETCEQLGLKAIIQDYNMFGGYQDIEVPATTDEEIAKSVENARIHMENRVIGGYYIWDEPYQNNLSWFAKQSMLLPQRSQTVCSLSDRSNRQARVIIGKTERLNLISTIMHRLSTRR